MPEAGKPAGAWPQLKDGVSRPPAAWPEPPALGVMSRTGRGAVPASRGVHQRSREKLFLLLLAV